MSKYADDTYYLKVKQTDKYTNVHKETNLSVSKYTKLKASTITKADN